MVILGCVALIAGCGSLGLWLAHRIRRRPVELRECLMALALLDTEIVWGSTPLPEAFCIVKERTDQPWQAFFSELQMRLQRGESAGLAWKETINQQNQYFCLKKEDWQVIGDVGKGLGRSDSQEQHKQLELVQRQLALMKEQAGVWSDKQAKMWSYLGFLCGIAGVLILI
ncbi:MAG TPA: stage III sporulation protein AB [Desulfosporosinus sp.]|nr:stage III sporulation protein AB [Desulfosporosinus sp.]